MSFLAPGRAVACVAIATLVAGCSPDRPVAEPSGPGVPQRSAGPTHDGWLVIQVTGLPEGAPAAITVRGPGTFTAAVSRSDTLIGLSTGSYTLTVDPVVHQAHQYRGEEASLTVTVKALSITTVPVRYAISTGALEISVAGLPSGATPDISVTGESGYSARVGGSVILTGLTPGGYAVSASSLFLDGTTWQPEPSRQIAEVTARLTPTLASIRYASGPGGTLPDAATVTVDTTLRYQMIQGWEAVAQAGQTEPGFPNWQGAVLDLAVDDLGLTRLRLEVRAGSENPQDHYRLRRMGLATNWRCQRWETVNDNDDPNTINPAGFHFSEVDTAMATVVMPMRQRLEARGARLFLTLNYVAFLGQCAPMPYVHQEAAEYAEFMLAAFRHLQATYGFTPDALEVILEPDVGTPWNPEMIGNAIVATRARLNAAGFFPEFIAPSTTDMGNASSWFDVIRAVPGMSGVPFMLSYHRYTGVTAANLAALGSRRAIHGVPTAMLEQIGAGVEELYQDLTVAMVSAWQQYTLAFPGPDDGGIYYPIVNGQPVPGSRTRFLRQYFRYVRPGSQRIGARSLNPAFRPVAFRHPDRGVVVVIHAGQGGALTVGGLPPGTYGASITTGSATGLELPGQTTGPTGTISLNVPDQGILTIYRRS